MRCRHARTRCGRHRRPAAAQARIDARRHQRGRLTTRDLDGKARPRQHAHPRAGRDLARDLVTQGAATAPRSPCTASTGRPGSTRSARASPAGPSVGVAIDDQALLARLPGMGQRRLEAGLDAQGLRQGNARQVAFVRPVRAPCTPPGLRHAPTAACRGGSRCSRPGRCPTLRRPGPRSSSRPRVAAQAVAVAPLPLPFAAPCFACSWASYMAWKLTSVRCTGGKPARVMMSATVARR